ncbi:MAG: 16S rRNA (uracil(1498)-N(3))-methyltransferase [Phormidesmis sp.]
MVQRITINLQQCRGASLTLEADQTHYLTRVLRLSAGDRFIAQDGQGQQWLAALGEQPDQAVLLETIAVAAPSMPPLKLIAALTKGNSFDQVVRQASELGATHIYPALSDRTLLKPSPNRLARWQRIAQEASEQSERARVPAVFAPVEFRTCLALAEHEADLHSLKYLCGARSAAQTDSPHLLAQLQTHLTSVNLPSVTLAIGPEGGWTTEEITVAIAHGYETVSLGSAILRAVTASITALSLVAATRELLI